MKNFPHQYSELGRFRGALSVIRDLLARGEDVLDDGVLGYALARAGFYRFRGEVPDLEARIATELEKPRGNQGARTAARDTRRTLQLLGFLDTESRPTESGTLLLQHALGSFDEITLWRQAVIGMRVVGQNGSVSHPMRILLRLLADRGPLARIELALALEAEDDGQAEYDRVARLIPIRTARERGDLDISESTLNNAVKILPAIALQLGLAADLGDERLSIAEAGEALFRADFQFGSISPPAVEQNGDVAPVPRRRAGTINRRIVPGTPNRFDAALLVTLSPDEQIEAARLRTERTNRHENIVNQVAAAFAEDFEVYEDPLSFDAMLVPKRAEDAHYLLEVKTLDLDEIDQTNRAVAQLLWYSWAIVARRYMGKDIRLGVVYDRMPNEEISRYLESLSIGAYCCSDLQIIACNDAARSLCNQPVRVPANYIDID